MSRTSPDNTDAAVAALRDIANGSRILSAEEARLFKGAEIEDAEIEQGGERPGLRRLTLTLLIPPKQAEALCAFALPERGSNEVKRRVEPVTDLLRKSMETDGPEGA